MPRPSNDLDAALLASGRALFPQTGCAGLSLRALSEHAGVNPGMFHYHFKSKDNFLRTLLQQWYEELFAGLQGQAALPGPPLARLRAALVQLARFARQHRPLVARVWLDAIGGEPVALDFMRDNAPRHLALLAELFNQAEAEGSLRALPPVQRLVFVGGSVMLPIVFGSSLLEQIAPPRTLRRAFEAEVMSDEAVAERVDLALAAITLPAQKQTRRAR